MKPASCARLSDCSFTTLPRESRWRTTSPWSALTKISSGTTRGALALSTVGRSITAGVTSGAVTMKITSSTSITSTYGTMLISCIGPRLRCTAGTLPHGLPVEDVGELLHEAFEARGEALDVVRIAVVRDHRGDRGEQADGGGDQRFGDAGRDLRERRLLHVRQAAERVHDAPHGAEQPDVRADRAGGGEEREVELEDHRRALERGAHRAPRVAHRVARDGRTVGGGK